MILCLYVYVGVSASILVARLKVSSCIHIDTYRILVLLYTTQSLLYSTYLKTYPKYPYNMYHYNMYIIPILQLISLLTYNLKEVSLFSTPIQSERLLYYIWHIYRSYHMIDIQIRNWCLYIICVYLSIYDGPSKLVMHVSYHTS